MYYAQMHANSLCENVNFNNTVEYLETSGDWRMSDLSRGTDPRSEKAGLVIYDRATCTYHLENSRPPVARCMDAIVIAADRKSVDEVVAEIERNTSLHRSTITSKSDKPIKLSKAA